MISFCVITDGKRPDKLGALLASITAQNIPDAETIITYDTNHQGLLGKMRNTACSAARNDILVVSDDDITLSPDFYKAVTDFGEAWNIMCPRVLSPDGSRYWDWRYWRGNGGQGMVDYSIPDDGHIIPPGCFVILRRRVWHCVKWSETLGFYQPPGEDIDYGIRLHDAGYRMTCNPAAVVYHNDPRYYQVGDFVLRRE